MPPSAGLDTGRLRTSLILILVGGPLVVLDLTISTGGPGVDVLNDTIGWVLIVIALAGLQNVAGPSTHRSKTQFVLLLAVVALIGSILVQVGLQASPLVAALFFVLAVGGAILFCITMRELVGFHGLTLSEASWRMSTTVVAAIWGGAGAIALVVSLASGDSYVELSGPGAVPLLLLILAFILTPCIFLVISIARTLREMGTRPLSR